ncbi:MAG: hypothetical protein IPK26_19650 [Planctomycetes bacterium]|nr:hypothetical protein [Planctomycetota bacterium]
MNRPATAMLLCATALPAQSATIATPATFTPDLYAIELPCDDVAASLPFWRDALHWQLERELLPAFAVLRHGELRLLLHHTRQPRATGNSPWLSINMRVGDFAATIAAVEKTGGTVDDPMPKPFALGQAVAVSDPAGNAVHLLQVETRPLAADAPPQVFNIGWHTRDLAATETFWTGLGLQVFAREFLPGTLPMQRHGAAALVFHHGDGLAAVDSKARRPTVWLQVQELEPAAAALRSRSGKVLDAHPIAGPLGRHVRLRDPDGLTVGIVERGPARLWYERLWHLTGTWQAESTKGWGNQIRYYPMAQGSVLVEDDPQGDRANSMMSCIAMDGNRLLLTHWCHAGNAPRLCADVANATADSITFVFLDGGNLASRDVGHMDEVTFTLQGTDRFATTWKWYQNGKSQTFETIKHVRVPAGPGGAR